LWIRSKDACAPWTSRSPSVDWWCWTALTWSWDEARCWGFQRPDSGTVTLDGRDVAGRSPAWLARAGARPRYRLVELDRELDIVGPVDEMGQLERALALAPAEATELEQGPAQRRIAGGNPDPGSPPLAEMGQLDRHAGPGQLDRAAQSRRRPPCLDLAERRHQIRKQAHGQVGVDQADGFPPDSQDRRHVGDGGAPLQAEELDQCRIGPPLLGADDLERPPARFQQGLDDPADHDRVPGGGHEGAPAPDPDDRAVPDQEVQRPPHHAPRDVELVFDLTLGGKAGSRRPAPGVELLAEGDGELEVEGDRA